jgi:hypothetical protein
MCYSSNAKMIQFNITFLICIILILGLSILVIFFIPEDLFYYKKKIKDVDTSKSILDSINSIDELNNYINLHRLLKENTIVPSPANAFNYCRLFFSIKNYGKFFYYIRGILTFVSLNFIIFIIIVRKKKIVKNNKKIFKTYLSFSIYNYIFIYLFMILTFFFCVFRILIIMQNNDENDEDTKIKGLNEYIYYNILCIITDFFIFCLFSFISYFSLENFLRLIELKGNDEDSHYLNVVKRFKINEKIDISNFSKENERINTNKNKVIEMIQNEENKDNNIIDNNINNNNTDPIVDNNVNNNNIEPRVDNNVNDNNTNVPTQDNNINEKQIIENQNNKEQIRQNDNMDNLNNDNEDENDEFLSQFNYNNNLQYKYNNYTTHHDPKKIPRPLNLYPPLSEKDQIQYKYYESDPHILKDDEFFKKKTGEKNLFRSPRQLQDFENKLHMTGESKSSWIPRIPQRTTYNNLTSVRYNILSPGKKSIFKTQDEITGLKIRNRVKSISDFVDVNRIAAENLSELFTNSIKDKKWFNRTDQVATNQADLHNTYRERIPYPFS